MITGLTVRRFKNLGEVRARLGGLTLVIGPNASGKSNLLDALRVLQGLAFGYEVREVFEGRYDETSRLAWPGVRGGARLAFDRGAPAAAPGTIELAIEVRREECEFAWELELAPEDGRIVRELLINLATRKPVYNTRPDGALPRSEPLGAVRRARVYIGKGGQQPHHDFSPAAAILTQLKGRRAGTAENESFAEACAGALKNVQFLDPLPGVMRQYAPRGAGRIGDRGEFFASVMHAIADDEAARRECLRWLNELSPARISDFHFFGTDLGEVMFGVKESSAAEPIPALALSDGTLRFAAVAAACFQPYPPEALLIEELENGVHATRLKILVEMLRERSTAGKPQVIATTHSPLLLTFLTEADYPYVLWTARDPATGRARILPLTGIPEFQELLRRTPISDLFAEGWLERSI